MPERVWSLGREARAVAKQGALIVRGVRPRPVVSPEARRAVVFVHGFGAARAVFEPLRRHVEREIEVATLGFSYGSMRSFVGVASALSDFIERNAPPEAELDLVGHSLGGLLARWYVQELGGAARVQRMVTLATPHAGTRSARIAVGPLRGALLPDNSIVRRLRQGRERAEHVAHTALVAGQDLMVTPPASAAAIRGAEVQWFDRIGHNGMLFDRGVHAAVVEALRG